MKVACLVSGGKDSIYASWVASRFHEICCFVSIVSENEFSFMFHTPSVSQVERQAEVAGVPILIERTKGEKEDELEDLKKVLKEAKKKFGIEGVVTGAVKSTYQTSRIQKICDEIGLEVFNPLWQKNEIELLNEIVDSGFDVIVVGVFAYPLDDSWLGRKIDRKFIEDVSELQKKFKINPAGEGGEFETFVLGCPLFKKKLKVKSFRDFGEENSWRREIRFANFRH